MNSIPKFWQWVQLKEVGEIITGNTPSTKDPSNYGGCIPFVKPPQLNSNFISEAPQALSKKGAEKVRVLPPNSVMVSCIGNLGMVAVNKCQMATNQQINSIIPNDSLDSKFLFYQIQSSHFLNQLDELSSATTVTIVNKGNFSKAKIVVPPLPIQHCIVEKIEELFSDLDNGIENLKKAKQQLETYKQSVLKAAFEGKLTAAWREQQDNLPTPEDLKKQIEEERKRYREQQLEGWRQKVKKWEEQGEPGRKPRKPRKPKSFEKPTGKELSALSKLPDNWYWEKLGFVSRSKGGHAFRSKNFKDEGKYQVIRMGNIRPGRLRLNENPVYLDEVDEKTKKKALLKEGDIIITLTGTRKKRDYGYSVMIDRDNLLLNQRIAYLRFYKKFDPLFFLYYSWTRSFKDQFFSYETGNVGQGNVSMTALSDTHVPVLSIEEQKIIVEQIESQLSVIDKNIETINNELRKANALRQSILKKAFSGKLVEEQKLNSNY